MRTLSCAILTLKRSGVFPCCSETWGNYARDFRPCPKLLKPRERPTESRVLSSPLALQSSRTCNGEMKSTKRCRLVPTKHKLYQFYLNTLDHIILKCWIPPISL